MTSANVVRLPVTFEAQVRHLIHWEALRTASAIVRDRLKAEGVKVALVAQSKITELALAHLRANAAELAQAEASGALQNLGVLNTRRAVDLTAKSLCRCHAQKWGAKSERRIRKGEH